MFCVLEWHSVNDYPLAEQDPNTISGKTVCDAGRGSQWCLLGRGKAEGLKGAALRSLHHNIEGSVSESSPSVRLLVSFLRGIVEVALLAVTKMRRGGCSKHSSQASKR